MEKNWPVYHRIDGPIVVLGYGSIGRGVLPLILRHFECDPKQITVIDPDDSNQALAESYGVNFLKVGIVEENYDSVLRPILTSGNGKGFMVNVSVDVQSLAIMQLCQELGTPYIDTIIETWCWDDVVADPNFGMAERSNYIERETVLKHRRSHPGGSTAVTCCGANPGMASWFVKQALLNLANDMHVSYAKPGPNDREGWAALMQKVGVKGIHIAERDTQRGTKPRPIGSFVNTWSVCGLIAEGLTQPAEMGWGTHEKTFPSIARRHANGCGAGISMTQPGGSTMVRSWTPTAKAQHGFLVTHNEAISISDYFTLKDGQTVSYRPTCNYAYRPCDDAVLSLQELRGQGWWHNKPEYILLEEKDIQSGINELGVLLYGHKKNAYWYGSQLSIEETRKLAPHQNATGLQVTSAVIAGMVWAIENPNAGIVEADEMDFERCLEVQMPYLGPVVGVYSDWNPLHERNFVFPENVDHEDPWQFSNILVA